MLKDQVWSIDLVDMSAFAEENAGYHYMLTCIDTATRYAWAIPMKTKSQESSWAAFQKILDSGRRPTKIWADEGSEFLNKTWKKNLIEIVLYATGAEKKAVMVERFNRTLKTNMWKEFTRKNNHQWVGIVPRLVKEYNNTKHSSIRKTPAFFSAHFSAPYDQEDDDIEEDPKYELRDWVRIARIKDTFEKGYTQRWSKELYQIIRISLNKPVMYYLRTADGKHVKGGFYESEVQKTAEPIEHYLASVGKAYNEDEDVVAVKVLSWRRDPKKKAKYSKYILTMEYSDGSTEEVGLQEFIGTQDANGVFKVTSRNPQHVLAPVGDFLAKDPVLRKEVWVTFGQ